MNSEPNLAHAAAVLETSKNMLRDNEGKMNDKELAPIALPDNELDGFRNGACLDLRVRFAMELLAHSPSLCDVVLTPSPKELARMALDVASELFALGEARGLITPFVDGVSAHLTKQSHRQAAYQIGGQKEAARIQEQDARIATAVHGAFRKN